MRLPYAIVFSACLLLATPNLVRAGPVDEAYKAVEGWAGAINSNKPDAEKVADIVSHYTPDARDARSTEPLFLPTKSPVLVTTKAGIGKYFAHFVEEEKPKVKLCEHEAITVSAGAVLFAGFYQFTLKGVPVPARYSFLVLNKGGRWLIAHHHSSVRPDNVECHPG